MPPPHRQASLALHPSRIRRLSLFACEALLPAGLAMPGCGPTDEIRHYQAVKLKQPEVQATDGMLAAVVLPEQTGGASPSEPAAAWFFKLAGPVEAVAPLAEEVQKFIRSVHFVDGHPQYDVPADWRAQGASQMRFETFEVPAGDKTLELTVTTLPRGEQDETTFLLANINRWRGQMSLLPLEPDELAEKTQRLPLDGATATLVSLTGKLKAGGIGAPFAPFAGGGDPHGAADTREGHQAAGQGGTSEGSKTGDGDGK